MPRPRECRESEPFGSAKAVTAGSARRATSAEPRTDDHFARPSLCFSVDLKDSDKAAGKDDAWESCGVMGHHDVERIPVIGFR
jgi:hypothetical protein